MTDKAVVVLSGGQDSTTCLYLMKEAGMELHAVTFDYNQRHRVEVVAARKIAKLAGVASHEVVELGPILKGTSPLVSGAELEQYSGHDALPGGLEKTFVPMRNQLFLTIAANRAFCLGCNLVVTGVCEEDFGGYPDCRRAFVDALEAASTLGTFVDGPGKHLEIRTPLMHLTKRQTVELALGLPGCYEALAFSHTGYDGSFPPTGHDHATLLRAKGFEEAQVPDPLVLRAYLLGSMALPSSPNYLGTLAPYMDRVRNVLHRPTV